MELLEEMGFGDESEKECGVCRLCSRGYSTRCKRNGAPMIFIAR
jgi:hypothetical protein